MTPFYVEYDSGYCTIVKADSREQAREKAGCSRVPGDRQSAVRMATEDDLAHFVGMGGAVR